MPLSDDELSSVKDSLTEQDLDRLDDDELSRLHRIMTRSPLSGIGEVSVQAKGRVEKLQAETAEEEPPSLLRDFGKNVATHLKGEGQALTQLPDKLGQLQDWTISKLSEPNDTEQWEVPAEGAPSPPTTADRIQAGTATVNRGVDFALRAVSNPFSPQGAMAGDFLLNIAKQSVEGIAKTAGKPFSTLRDDPVTALGAAADVAGLAALAKVATVGKVGRGAALIDAAAPALEASPSMAAAAMPAVDDSIRAASEALGIAARAGDDTVVKQSAEVGSRLEALKERLATSAGKTAQEQMDEVRASKITAAPAATEQAAAVDAARASGEAGFADTVLAARLGSSALGATIGAAINEDAEGNRAPISGAIMGALVGGGAATALTQPGVGAALKQAVSIGKKGKKGDFEQLARTLIEPWLPDEYLMGDKLPLAGAALGATAGGIVGANPEQGGFDPTGMLAGAAMGGALGTFGGKAAQPLLQNRGGFNPLRTFRRAFTEDAGLPAEVVQARKTMRNNLAGRVDTIMDLARRLEKYDAVTKGEIDDFVRGKLGPYRLSGKALDDASALRTTIDDLSLDLVDVGIAEGDLAHTIISNYGTYLPRLFLHHERGDALQKVARYMQSRGEPLSKLSDLSYLKTRKDLPDSVRAALGELSNEFGNAAPGYLLGRRGTTVAADVEFARYTNFLASSPDYVLPQSWATGQGPAALGFQKIKGPGGVDMLVDSAGQRWRKMDDSKRLGNLRNRFVQEDIAYDLEATLSTPQSLARSILDLGTGAFKASKISFNPASQVRNIIGNTVLADQAGLSPARVDIYAGALRDYAKKTPLYHEARGAGLFGGTFYGTEIAEMAKAIGSAPNALGGMVSHLAKNMDAPLHKMERIGRASEEFYKLAVYKYARESLGMDVAQAVEHAQKWIFDYREVPEWIKVVRKSPVGAPFISFSYKAMPRILENAVALGDPRAMMRFWKWPLMMGAVNEYSANKLGLRDKADSFLGTLKNVALSGLGFNDDVYKRLMPDYVGRNQILMPWKDEFGRQQYYDATWTLPWGDIGEFGQGQVGKQLAKAGIPFPRQLEPSNPWLQMVATGLTGKDLFTGRDVVSPGAGTQEAAIDMARFGWKLWAPSLAPSGFGYDKIGRAFSGDVVSDPYTPTPADALRSEIGGIKIRPLDPRQAFAKKAREFKADLQERKRELRRLQMNTRTAPELIEQRRKELQKFVKSFTEKYGDPDALPPTPPELTDAMQRVRQ